MVVCGSSSRPMAEEEDIVILDGERGLVKSFSLRRGVSGDSV